MSSTQPTKKADEEISATAPDTPDEEAICKDISAVLKAQAEDPLLQQWVKACEKHATLSTNDHKVDVDLYFVGRRLIAEAQLGGAIDQAKRDLAIAGLAFEGRR